MRTFILSLFALLILTSCKPEKNELTVQQIIDKSLEASQTPKVAQAELSFDFRGRTYIANRNNGTFSLFRITRNDQDTITDILSNKGFSRSVNNKPVQVPDSMAIRYSESVNSVHYFSVLPFGLNDAAVNKKLLEEVKIKGKEYYKIQVTFDQEGGGVDFEDVFVYWIGKEDFKIDYLAYLFHVNGGGKRFREVRKEHLINGVRFVDYNNYKPKDTSIDVFSMDKAFENDELEKVSEINLENIELTFLN